MLRCTAFAALLFAAALASAAEDDGAVLRRQAQELMDAVTYGKSQVWDAYLDPQVVYVDEAGEVSDKAALLAQIKPLPEGITGSIKTEVTELRFHGDTAVMRVD